MRVLVSDSFKEVALRRPVVVGGEGPNDLASIPAARAVDFIDAGQPGLLQLLPKVTGRGHKLRKDQDLLALQVVVIL